MRNKVIISQIRRLKMARNRYELRVYGVNNLGTI
jgi:hypothetical protein